MSSSEPARLWAVVMAGGAGTRFWPLSRRARPKQLLPLLHGRSPLAATVERLQPLVPLERTLVVVGRDVIEASRAELPGLPEGNLLIEPVGRNTAACVGLAAWWLARHDPGAITIVLPADHAIGEGGALRRVLAAAAATAHARGGLVTLGIHPTRPETGYGYIELGEKVGEVADLPVHRVARFLEKPDRATAEEMLTAGGYRWNSGMFVWHVEAIRGALRRHLPELASGLDRLYVAAEEEGLSRALDHHYPALPSISIDYGVMERAADVWVLPVSLDWSDLGSWPGLAEVVPAIGDNVAIGATLSVGAKGCILASDGPLIAAVGVTDLVVVATADAVLVVPKEQAQRVKEIVERLHAAGRKDLL